METGVVVPVISTSVCGPLGIPHLPRLWLKILLHAAGRLPDGYRHGEGGFDQSLCEHFGIDREAFVRFVETEKPTYPALEAWVREHATALEPDAVASWQAYIAGRDMNPEMAAERRARFGIADETFARAVALNDLDDWATAHELLTAPRAAPAN